MKKQLKLFAMLLIIALSTLAFAGKTLFPAVNAIYVEGPIMQNTVWTLVDSPFVLSKDVIVYPNVTLTIEPEVEVKFGGNFSLIVEGRLVAKGTKDKMIRFTSNRYEPEAGDWWAIKFNGTHSSSLIYCSIEYGTNGITVENGTLNIQNSLVSLNSENGIMITNGYVEVKNNEIVNNTMSGIYIAGGNQVTVRNNSIMSNGDGITLTGNLTSEINIYQNKIWSNRQSGILLEASAYDKTDIRNNTLSANSYGFYVSSNASTYITRNYISNNTVGIFYDKGSHTVNYTDIYNNQMGMDVAFNATVNAEYNYWGHESGPYHESLNPAGKGNPVGGDGVNLDFIFFLTASIDYNNTFPTAILWTDKTLVALNQNVTFIGTDSYDDGRVDQYFFDFGDGTNSSWTTLSLFTHNYSSTGTYNAKLTVMDDFGNESDGSVVVINVQNLAPLEASISLSNYSVSCNEQVSVTVYVSDGISAVENATVALFSVKGGSFTPLSGLTNSTGYFTATFTAPNVTEVTNVRIIARASKAGYADGSDYKYLKVLPSLTVQVTTEPATIKSEETATVTIRVTFGVEKPVADALLILAFDHGNLSATIGVTDVNGSATFIFTAPQTLSQVNVTIMATAIKMGYAEGHGQGTIIVEPKILVVEVIADPAVIVSEAVSTITVHVTSDSAPISDVTITVSSDSGGNFSATTETTDSKGNARFVFTAPQTTERPRNITITATATKGGYADGENQLEITVNPRTFNIQVEVSPTTVKSEETATVSIHVTCKEDATPVTGATVTILSTNGNFSVM
ncbi:MAG: NosD domain-containing protein, partial [Candidatus Bathyarchaeia archaeon]|nr:NosD domain-containing protein [Candidatus Bathyarchaeia archaeon]